MDSINNINNFLLDYFGIFLYFRYRNLQGRNSKHFRYYATKNLNIAKRSTIFPH